MRQREVDDAMMPDEHEHEQRHTSTKWRLWTICVKTEKMTMTMVSVASDGSSDSNLPLTWYCALDHAIVKRRVDMLLEAYRKNEMSGLRGSGSPEEFDMRNKLLAILARVVDEQTLNKGVTREKRVQSALQAAQHNLEELEGTVGMVLPVSADLTPPPAVATPPLMPIAPVPAASLAIVSHGNSSPVLPSLSTQRNVQQNGSNKRALRTVAVSVASPMQEVKRPRVEKTALAMETTLGMEERKLRLEERRVALEEERLAWEKQKSEQDEKERQALLDVLRAQGSLVSELLTHLRSSKIPSNTQDL
ncbi:unnamed protein product [Peronospora destructor]|uniref:Uncharacterized protein n=1 Tax=Peronospora destructor TaxID=86335 RepID=A0AAV0UWW0_9STRA|nr:unnamed protein product [Peronospora destructor]